ncbi:MAG: hypothetical protein C4534_06885 [Gaiellales bacterium]|nr:MAG: hypothetical protein C4534_06885 [Gaiellales bacterium]
MVRYTRIGGGCPESGCAGSTPAGWNGAARPVELAVSGSRIVWTDERSGSGNTDIYLIDLDQPSQQEQLISADAQGLPAPGRQESPAIDGDWVAWVDAGDVHARHIATGQEYVNAGNSPAISGERLVYRSPDGSGFWLWDLTEPAGAPAQISGSAGANPDIDGDYVVWSASGSPARLKLYDIATGAFYYGHTDIDIPTRGLPLSIERTYNSNDQVDSPFGYGWSFNWQMDAVVESGGDVVVRRGDGRRDTFTLNPDGSYSAPAGRHDALIKHPDSTYTLVTREKVTYSFDGDGRLASLTTATGQQTLLTHEGGELQSITAPDGRSLTLSWDAGHIAAISWPHEGDTYSVAYSYSPAGDLTAVTDQSGGRTTYEYDAFHQLTAIRDPNATALEPDGAPFVENVYDAEGRVSEQRDAGGDLVLFDYSVPLQTTITRVMDPGDPSKNQVRVHYHDDSWRLIRETDALGLDTTYEYDSAGNRYKMTDRRGVVTRQVFDMSGNVTDLYRAEGLPEEEHTHTTYNSMNRPVSVTDPRGQTTSYTYDAAGLMLIRVDLPPVSGYDGSQALYSEEFSYDADGLLASATDRNGDVTTFTYDAYGYPDTVTRNANRAPEERELTDYDYDDLGRKAAETGPRGNVTTYSYSAMGDLLSATGIVTSQITGLPMAVVTSYTYDANGNRTSTTDPEGNTTSFDYTAMNNLRLTTDALGNTIEHTYDAAGNRTATKDRNGNWTYFGYDRENRLITVEDPEHRVTAYGYDAEGNRATITDPLTNTVTMSYDGLGRITAVTESDEGGAARTHELRL